MGGWVCLVNVCWMFLESAWKDRLHKYFRFDRFGGETVLVTSGIKLGRLDYTSIFASIDLVLRQYWLLLESS